MTDIDRWAPNANDNNTSAPPDYPPEGMARTDVNDTEREFMASVRRYMDSADWFNPCELPLPNPVATVSRLNPTTALIEGRLLASVFPSGRRVRLRLSAGSPEFAYVDTATEVGPDTQVAVIDPSYLGDMPANVNGIDVFHLGRETGSVGRGAFSDFVEPNVTFLTADMLTQTGTLEPVTFFQGLTFPLAPDGQRDYRIRSEFILSNGSSGANVTMALHVGPAGTIADPAVATIAVTGTAADQRFDFGYVRVMPNAGERLTVSIEATPAVTVQQHGVGNVGGVLRQGYAERQII